MVTEFADVFGYVLAAALLVTRVAQALKVPKSVLPVVAVLVGAFAGGMSALRDHLLPMGVVEMVIFGGMTGFAAVGCRSVAKPAVVAANAIIDRTPWLAWLPKTQRQRLLRWVFGLPEEEVLTLADVEARRLAREERLRALGFEEPTAEQRKANLALNVQGPKDG